ncbi:MAG: MCE family protein [Actinomycetota bacterium]|nr:MCE family protein [Actinomycetota bacterium]
MCRTPKVLRRSAATLVALVLFAVPGCAFQGVNSLPLPGTEGGGPGSFVVQAELPDVTNIARNSRVRVGDVTVGTVTDIERQGWHALVTMRLDGDVMLPANTTATVGQTSLLGALHVELAPPADAPARGRLHQGSLIPLSHGGAYPTTEQTLAAVSMLLNGGGLGQVHDITGALSTAFGGREDELREFIEQVRRFAGNLDAQKADIIAATESLDRLAGQLADQQPVLEDALRVLPGALGAVNDAKAELVSAADQFGSFATATADTLDETKDALANELADLGPVAAALADAGPSLTRSLSLLTTYPWVKETLPNWMRGDYANLILVLDMTLSRLDAAMFTGTRWEGDLTELEMQWGRTIGQMPSPYTSGNPLVVPYRTDQGR